MNFMAALRGELRNPLQAAVQQCREAEQTIEKLEKCWDRCHSVEFQQEVMHDISYSCKVHDEVPYEVWLELREWYAKNHFTQNEARTGICVNTMAQAMLVIPQLKYIIMQHLKSWRVIKAKQQNRMKEMESSISNE